VGFVVPQLSGSESSPVLNECDVLVIAHIGKDDPSVQSKETHPAVAFEAVVMPKLVRQGRRDVLRGLVESL
jgi:hypothetical protein